MHYQLMRLSAPLGAFHYGGAGMIPTTSTYVRSGGAFERRGRKTVSEPLCDLVLFLSPGGVHFGANRVCSACLKTVSRPMMIQDMCYFRAPSRAMRRTHPIPRSVLKALLRSVVALPVTKDHSKLLLPLTARGDEAACSGLFGVFLEGGSLRCWRNGNTAIPGML